MSLATMDAYLRVDFPPSTVSRVQLVGTVDAFQQDWIRPVLRGLNAGKSRHILMDSY